MQIQTQKNKSANIAQELQLINPHSKQLEIIKGEGRYKVIACGRRFGKTKMAETILQLYALTGQTVAWVAPTTKIMQEVFESCINTLHPLILNLSRRHQRIELTTRGVIEFWSADIDKPCESRKYKFVVIDEAGSVPKLQRQWENSIRPTLTDLQGKAWFIGTPKGLNYFYDLANLGMQKQNGFAFYHATTYDNPYISKTEIEEARQTLPGIVFQQEYLAQFVSGAGALVKREWIKVEPPPPDLEILMGVDLAIATNTLADYTATAILGRQQVGDGFKYYVLDVDRTKKSFHGILDFIKNKALYYKPKRIIIESVQAQQWLVQELVRTTNLPVVAEVPKADKVTRATSLLAKYEHGLIYHSPQITAGQEFQDELLSFPIGFHDDMVDALVYAFNGFGYLTQAPKVGWL